MFFASSLLSFSDLDSGNKSTRLHKTDFFGLFFAGPTNVEKRSANDFNDFVEDTKNSILGGICITDNDCSFISYCDKSDRKFSCIINI